MRHLMSPLDLSVEELDKLDRMRKRRKRLAEEYREREFKDEDENA